MKLSITPLKKKNLPFLLEIRNECKEFLHDNREFNLLDCQKWFKEVIPEYFICLLDNDQVGYFRTSLWSRDSCFVGMDLHKDFRGRGYAKPLYYLFFIFLKEVCGLSFVYLEVLESNSRALNLYKDLGFNIIDERDVIGRGRSFTMTKIIK